MQKYKALRGTTDILPDEAGRWQALESVCRRLFALYGYGEIRTPVIEPAALFKRGIGETTDIVEKQMFEFSDRGGRAVCLRPEATAAVIRAYLEHSLDKKENFTKLFYIGPMFRSERPQAGRSRQFHQIGVEAIGSDSPYLDAETISLLAQILKDAGLKGFKIKLNSLGCAKDKIAYSKTLKAKLKTKVNLLCGDCKKRYEKNVLRILDCKKEPCRQAVRGLPKISSSICGDCAEHFDKVKAALKIFKTDFVIEPYLVRGLDYYTRTAFEVTHSQLGAQDALAAGGRYDNLVADFGGPDMGAVGFAIGIERTLNALKTMSHRVGGTMSHLRGGTYVVTGTGVPKEASVGLLNALRLEGISAEMDYQDRSLKAQMRQASKLGVKFALILGEDELARGEVGVKNMETGEQRAVALGGVAEWLKNS